jgi:ketosteroid isomerase-like protein
MTMSKSNLALAPRNPNIELVQSLYAAFMRGDVDFILGRSTPDVTIGLDGRPSDAPMLGHHKGHAGMRDFFRILAESHDITAFTPQEFYSDGDKVFVVGHYTWVMKPSGVKGGSDWFHIWTIRDGKAASCRSLNDTALLAQAWRG